MFISKRTDVESVMSEIRRARRRGLGLRYQDWEFDVTYDEEPGAVVEAMIGWCKAMLSTCRRPHGIDLFDLVVAFRAEANGAVRSFRLERLKPLELYQDSLPELLLQRLNEVIHSPASTLYVSAGFFSWGDAAHNALPSR